MALPTCNEDMNIISKLDDEPNDVGGLSAASLKAKFDLAGNLLKKALNDLVAALGGESAAKCIGFVATEAVNKTNVQEAIENVQAQIADVTQGGIADGAVTTDKLADGAVTTEKIANGAVTYHQIANETIGSPELANNAVAASKIASSAVQERHIFNGAVTESKLAGESVTQAKIATAAVTSNKIAMRAVTKDKIADGAVTKEKLASNALDSVLNAYFLKVYPVGAFYFSASSDNPATLFGGTWTQIKDTFILAAGTKYKAGTTGGEATHTLTAPEMPNHYHDEYAGNDGGDSSAPSGQNWLHHFRSTANSNTRTAGNTTSERATSLNWKRRHNATMVANVKPTGHIRQNTGNPNTAVDKSAPPSTQLRESPAPPRLELGMSSASSLEDRKSLLRLPAPSLAASRDEPDPKMRRRSGTGHPQAQNARPNTSTSTTPMANAMSIGGTTVLAARATSTAPSGQIAAMS